MIDWELNLFHSDPTLLERSDDHTYERAGRTLAALGEPDRLKLVHALAVGADTAQRAAVWAGLPQPYAERELAAMALLGLVERRDLGDGPRYVPRDGHLVVELFVALAHGRELLGERHPRLLARRRARQAMVRKVG